MKQKQITTFRRNGRRQGRGTTIAEMPVVMWVMIVGICLPVMILAVGTLRFGFFWNACREAAQQAARCQTFQVDSSLGKSAVNTADQVATMATNSFTGISLSGPVKVYILQTDVNAGTSTQNPDRQKLPAAADIDRNIYEIQVELDGQVDPLIRYPVQGMFGSIPGLTGPFPVTVKAQNSCEIPQGLNQ